METLTQVRQKLNALLDVQPNRRDEKIYRLELAKTWHKLGILQREFRCWEDAENSLAQSYKLYCKLGIAYADLKAGVCFDLALLNSEQQHWKKAENNFRKTQRTLRQLGAQNTTSPLADELADTCLNWAILKCRRQQWHGAETLLKKALRLYVRLGAKQSTSRYTHELAEIGLNLAIVRQAQHQPDKALELLQNAENLYLQIGADSSDSPYAADLAQTRLQFGLLLQSCCKHKQAAAMIKKAQAIYLRLHGSQQNSPYSDELAETCLHLTLLYSETEQWSEVNKTLQQVLQLYAKLSHFPGDFVEELIQLSALATHRPITATSLFRQLSALLVKWQTIQIGDEALFKRTQPFWRFWLSFALAHDNQSLLLDVLCACHGQRLLELLHFNLQQHQQVANTDVRRFYILQQRLRQFELALLTLQSPLPSQMTPYQRQKKQRLKKLYHRTRDLWLTLRERILSQGKDGFKLLPILNTKDLQNGLAQYEAIVFTVALTVYGLNEAPRLLIIRRDSVENIALPILNQAVSAMRTINSELIAHGRCLPLRCPIVADNSTIEFNPATLETGLAELQTAMQAYRNILNNLFVDDIRFVHIVSHGPFHGLPWQYSCPQPDSAFYPGLHVFWQRRHADKDVHPVYPNAESPLCLLAHDSENNPLMRLYHLPAEIELIRRIWGDHRVETPGTLPLGDEKSRLLFLLGHGSFDNGNAQFNLAQHNLDPYDVIAYPNPLITLGTSACLLACNQDIEDESLGFFSLTACRRDIRFGIGAVVPVDDLWATCLSLLFHFYWRELGQPDPAIRMALEALATGNWPETAKILFKAIMCEQLPVIFATLQHDIDQAPATIQNPLRQRSENFIQQWTRHTACYVHNHRTLLDIHADSEAKQQAAEGLVDGFLENLANNQQALATFLPFWLWG